MVKAELEQLLHEGKTIREIAAVKNKGFTTIRYWMHIHGLTPNASRRQIVNGKHDAALPGVVANATSVTQVLIALGLPTSGGSHTGIKSAITRLGLSTDHFTPTQGLTAAANRHNRSAAHLQPEAVFSLDATCSQNHLRRLAQAHITPYACAECSCGPEWQGRPLTLQLDHINGNNRDNRRENLRWLCPNCHTQTRTWGKKPR